MKKGGKSPPFFDLSLELVARRFRRFEPSETIGAPKSSPPQGVTPAVATLAGAENFTAAARRAAVCAGIFPALLNGFERAQLQPQFAHFFFVRALRALAAAPQPWPAKRHIAGLRGRDNSKLRKAAAAELFLQLGALHESHTAHLHRAPDHSAWITPLVQRNLFD